MDELFYYTGYNGDSLGKFLHLKREEYALILKQNDKCDFVFENITVTPDSLVYYCYKDDQYDFFLLDK